MTCFPFKSTKQVFPAFSQAWFGHRGSSISPLISSATSRTQQILEGNSSGFGVIQRSLVFPPPLVGLIGRPPQFPPWFEATLRSEPLLTSELRPPPAFRHVRLDRKEVLTSKSTRTCSGGWRDRVSAVEPGCPWKCWG